MFAALPPVFAGIPRTEADLAASLLRQIEVEPGDVLMYEGEQDQTLAFVVSGTVEIWRGDIKVGSSGPGDLVGEIELYSGTARVGSATAVGPVTLYALEAEAFVSLCESANPIVFAIERAIHRRLCDRVRSLDVGISERTAGEPFTLEPPQKGFFGRLSDRIRGGPEETSASTVVGALGQSALFDWATRDIVEAISGFFDLQTYGPEMVVSRQGRDADRLFVVVEGKVEVVLLLGNDRAESLTVLDEGGSFGDAGLALGSPRTASAVSRGRVVTLELPRGNFLTLYEMDDSLGSTFRQGLIRSMIRQLLGRMDRFADLERVRLDQVAHTASSRGSHIWRD